MNFLISPTLCSQASLPFSAARVGLTALMKSALCLGIAAGAPPMPPISVSAGTNRLQGFALATNTFTPVLTINCTSTQTVSCTNTTWTFDTPTGSTTCSNLTVTVVITSTVTNDQSCF